MLNQGVDLTTLSPAQLARQALVLFVDGGQPAAELMDRLEAQHLRAEQAIADAAELAASGPVVDDMLAMPEGMSLREGSLGVIPPHA